MRYAPWIASCAAIAVALHVSPRMSTPSRSVLLAAGLLGVLVLARRHWWRKRSAALAIVLAVSIVFASTLLRVPVDLYSAVARYQSVFELLVGVGLARKVFARVHLELTLSEVAGRLSERLRAPLLCILACILAVPLSVASVAILCAAFAEVVRPRTATATVSMRAVSATMFILPTTAGAAVVSASMPDLDHVRVLRLGLPLFVLALLGSCLQRINIAVVTRRVEHKQPSFLWPVAAFWIILGALLLLARLHGAAAIALAGLSTFLLEAVLTKRDLGSTAEDLQEAIGGVTTELLLLCACGLLTGFLAHSPLPSSVRDSIHHAVATPAVALGLVLFVLPCLSLIGVHPLILFSVMFPLANGAILGDRPLQYLVWSTMFANSQLMSPMSTSARLAASSLGVDAAHTSFRIHLIYTAGLATTVWAYALLLRT